MPGPPCDRGILGCPRTRRGGERHAVRGRTTAWVAPSTPARPHTWSPTRISTSIRVPARIRNPTRAGPGIQAQAGVRRPARARTATPARVGTANPERAEAGIQAGVRNAARVCARSAARVGARIGARVTGPSISRTQAAVPARVRAKRKVAAPARLIPPVRIVRAIKGRILIGAGGGPTPARVPGGTRTAVAHAPSPVPDTSPAAAATRWKSLHHEAPAHPPPPFRPGRSPPPFPLVRTLHPRVAGTDDRPSARASTP